MCVFVCVCVALRSYDWYVLDDVSVATRMPDASTGPPTTTSSNTLSTLSTIADDQTSLAIISTTADHPYASLSTIPNVPTPLAILSTAAELPTASTSLSAISDIHPMPTTSSTTLDCIPSTPISSNTATVVQHLSPIDIRPYPVAQRSTTTARKRTAMRAEIVTASPYKSMLVKKQMVKQAITDKKEKKKENRPKQICRRDVKKRLQYPKPPGKEKKPCKKPVGKGVGLQVKPPQSENKEAAEGNSGEGLCTGCGEVGGAENWVQCNYCRKWWHIACSAYNGHGGFRCDLCLC